MLMVREDLFHLMLKYYLSSNLLISLLGQRKNLTPEIMANFVKKFKYAGATILGGCCETRPCHIKEINKLK